MTCQQHDKQILYTILCINKHDCYSIIVYSLFVAAPIVCGDYNHATSNKAIYSHETSQDKLPEA